MIESAIIIHSGAGYFSDDRNSNKIETAKKAAKEGYIVLKQTDDPVDAVERAVKIMEDDVDCNAGYGSVLSRDGEVEMDAMIIRGSNLATGGVGAVKHIANPITLARAVMEKSQHSLLVGSGAEEFAISHGFQLVETASLISPRALQMLEAVLARKMAPSTETGGYVPIAPKSDNHSISKESGMGTVGAVAINSKGELAAATSTGGISGKLPGRVGDTPIPGGGTYCDDEICGISATGLGEAIMKVCLCSRVANLIEKGINPDEACLTALNYMTSKIPEGNGGLIVITKNGEIAHNLNSRKMTWAYVKGNELHHGIGKGEDIVEIWEP